MFPQSKQIWSSLPFCLPLHNKKERSTSIIQERPNNNIIIHQRNIKRHRCTPIHLLINLIYERHTFIPSTYFWIQNLICVSPETTESWDFRSDKRKNIVPRRSRSRKWSEGVDSNGRETFVIDANSTVAGDVEIEMAAVGVETGSKELEMGYGVYPVMRCWCFVSNLFVKEEGYAFCAAPHIPNED